MYNLLFQIKGYMELFFEDLIPLLCPYPFLKDSLKLTVFVDPHPHSKLSASENR